MASCIAVTHGVDSDGVTNLLFLNLALAGAEVNMGTGELVTIQVVILPADSPAQLQAKMTAAITAHGTERGYVISPSLMILPAFTKG
jgi:hypothetical protein